MIARGGEALPRVFLRRLALWVLVCALLGATAWVVAPGAWARGGRGRARHLAAANPSGAPALVPIDELEDQVIFKQRLLGRSGKARKALTVKRAYEALMAKKFPQARKIAAGLLSDPIYGDYGYWITASTYVGEARKAFDTGKNADTMALAQKAINAELQIATQSPYSPHLRTLPRDLAQGEILFGSGLARQKKWAPAQRRFENGFQRLTGTNELGLVRPENLGLYAESCSKSPSPMCTAWLQKFAQILPRNSVEMRAVLKFKLPVLDRVRPYFPSGKATASYKAPDRDYEAFDEAMGQVLNGKYGDATKSLEKFIDEFPKSVFRFRARYWLSESLARDKKKDEAQKYRDDLYKDSPLTYYGLLAAISANKGTEELVSGEVPKGIAIDPFLTPQELFRLKRAEDFVSENALDLAAIELRDIRPRDTLSSPFLVYLAMLNFQAMNYNPAFIIVNELIQRNYDGLHSGFILKMIFPVRFMAIVEKNAEENHVDPILLLSLIKQESAFDANAVSGVGALGLMQLMPSTAADIAPETSRADLLTADANIRAGARYLARLLTRFHGNIVLALAGYNAGPNAADRWYRNNKGKERPMVDFIETIPYKETREYVSAIIRNYFWYAKNLAQEATPTLAYFWGGERATPAVVAAKPAEGKPELLSASPGPSASPAPLATASASPEPVATASPAPSPTPSSAPSPTAPDAAPAGDNVPAPTANESPGDPLTDAPPTAPVVPTMSQ